jgi:hypothetical protein
MNSFIKRLVINSIKVKILVGEYKNEIAHVTGGDDKYINVTPISGHPLTSLQFKHNEVLEQ